ncbi:hypothetical protein GCM10027046_38500 [Uliginosibacterium flavum]|uniref:DUF4350 domain-containing protein n=1 Tax=Uliginosibacterium flavum TaxID=1396831 RepID=A0ABV2TKV3_9RHOO
MNKARLILIAALLVLLGALGWYLYDNLTWHATTKRTGYSKEALRNDYHAGMLLLSRLGYPAERSEDLTRLNDLASDSTLLLSGHESFADPALRAKLLGWIERGGHLVLPLAEQDDKDPLLAALGVNLRGNLSYAEEERALLIEGRHLKLKLRHTPVFDLDDNAIWSVDLHGSFPESSDDEEARIFTVGEAPSGGSHSQGGSGTCPAPATAQSTPDETAAPVGLAPHPETAGLAPAPIGLAGEAQPAPEAQAAGDVDEAEAESETEPEVDIDSDSSVTDESAEAGEVTSIYARFRHGKGYVTVGDFSPFDNDSLAKADHAPFFIRLLSLPEGKRPVLMLFAPDYPGLLEWLAAHAPEALLALAILIIAGLRRVAPRFGPLLPEPAPVRPGLGEHLAASGHFLLKQRAYEPLIAPLREDVLRQLEALQHRHPEIDSREALGEHLTGIKAGEIHRALTPEPDSHHEFLRRCQTLALLRDHCKRLRQPTLDSRTQP